MHRIEKEDHGGGYWMKIHIVQSGDSLTTLAKKYHISEDQIMKANPNLNKSQSLKTGSKIYIPSGKIRLTKEVEKKEENTESKHDLAPPYTQHDDAFASSSQQAPAAFESEIRPEADESESTPYAADWSPTPPGIPHLWACSYYPMMPPHPYFMGQINSLYWSPYYFYPYTYEPGFQNDVDLNHDLPFSNESSSYYTRTSWDSNWSEKESSSVEG